MAPRKKSVKQRSRIDVIFDDIEHLVERSERVLMKLIISIGLLALLAFEVYLVGKLLSKGH